MKENKSHRARASVIVIDKNKKRFLLMYRNISGIEKYVLLGGGVESGESIEEAAVREVREESSLDIKLSKKLTEIKYKTCTDYVFLAEDFSGELKLSGEEIDRATRNNIYRPEWIEIKNLDKMNIPIYPKFIVKLILKEFL